MEYCLTSKKNDCKNCYKCIRGCPTKSISFADNQASIIHDDCILCGQCYVACPQGTKVIRNDVDKVKKMITSGRPVYVSLAPSYIANYHGSSIRTMKDALLKLGFIDVEETAIGATIVKKAYEEMVKDKQHDVIISSCCHSINLLIQKHYPKALPYLADVLSPMLAHGQDIKSRVKDAYVVFIGPCIAKKDEADKNNEFVDAVLTYAELSRWFADEKITIEKETNNILIEESKARLFPTSGGILATMDCSEDDYEYIVVDGMTNAIHALEDILSGNVHHCFIEMSACAGSCINGPVIDTNARELIQDYLAVKKSAGKKDFVTSERKYHDIKKNFYPINIIHATPSEKEIAQILKEMGKTSKNKELNCGSCGYDSCRSKAIAILQGKAIPEMCLPFLMEKAQSFSNNIVYNTPNGLMVLNENLDIQLMNQSMCRLIGVPSADGLINKNVTTILEPDLYAKALGGVELIKGKKEYLAEYNKYVEETIVYDKKFHIIISIMRDITNESQVAQRKEEMIKKSISITDKVIEKNMRAVQEIASLLGESAAETKIALSSLKETLKDDK